MANTYGAQIIENLESMRLMALLHPRLALLGVAVELELLMRETVPEALIERLARSLRDMRNRTNTKQMSMTQARTEVTRDFLKSASQIRELLPDFRKWAERIVRRGNDCRHTRTPVSRDEVEKAVDKAIEFVASLRQTRIDETFVCEKHEFVRHFPMAFALEDPQGTVYPVICPKCKEEWEGRRKTDRRFTEYKTKRAEWEAKLVARGIRLEQFHSALARKITGGLQAVPPPVELTRPPTIGWVGVPGIDESELMTEDDFALRRRARSLMARLRKTQE